MLKIFEKTFILENYSEIENAVFAPKTPKKTPKNGRNLGKLPSESEKVLRLDISYLTQAQKRKVVKNLIIRKKGLSGLGITNGGYFDETPVYLVKE